MKIDIQNIIYIIAIIAWVVIGFIKKNKKKDGRPATTMPPVGEPQQPDIGDILEELLGKKREEQKPVFVPPQKQKQIKKQIQQQSLETISGTDYTQRSIKKTHNSKLASELRTSDSELSLDIHSIFEESQFDLRKAIIYSEILKPPYQ